MPRGGAHFTGEELERVLAQYNLGRVQETHTLATGSRRSPKKILVTERGTFVLKRRARGKDDMYHVAFAHSVQTFLQKKGFAVSPLALTRDNTTVLCLDGHTYELFHFVMPELLQKGTVLGVEYQLYDTAGREVSANTSLGAAYELFAPNGVHPKPADQWNTAGIVSKNGKVQHWLNGRLVLEFDRLSDAFQQAKAKSKFKDVDQFGTIEKGFILLQDHPKETAFRNIKIRLL